MFFVNKRLHDKFIFSAAERDIKKEDFLKANFHFGKFIFVWPNYKNNNKK